jgi:hypothetical protein
LDAWLGAIRRTLDKSGKLNKRGAVWTAISVAFAGLSSLVATLI